MTVTEAVLITTKVRLLPPISILMNISLFSHHNMYIYPLNQASTAATVRDSFKHGVKLVPFSHGAWESKTMLLLLFL